MTRFERDFSPNSLQRRVERISQSVVEVVSDEGSFDAIRFVFLRWLAAKSGGRLPASIVEGGSGEFDEIGYQRVETAAIDEPRYWAARQDDQDDKCPGRTWVTEAALAQKGPKSLIVGHRLHCVTLGQPAPFSRSVPRFMREIARQYETRLDGAEIELAACRLYGGGDVDAFLRLLRSPRRTHPIIGISEDFEHGGERGTLVDADQIASAVFGTAHVYVLTYEAAEQLTRSVDRELSVFHAGVRTWRPNFNDEDSGYTHPLSTARRIREWVGGLSTFQREIIDWTLRYSAARRDALSALPPFAEVRHAAAQLQRQRTKEAGGTEAELLGLALEENDRLSCDMAQLKDEHEGILELAEVEARELRAERDLALSEQQRLRNRLTALEAALKEQASQAEPTYPATLRELGVWADENLGDAVVLLPRAANMAKKSPFEEVSFVYQSLEALRDFYVPMRRQASPERKSAWERRMSELGLALTPSFAGAGAGEFGDEYRVVWDGRTRELELHLKGSSSRDPRFGFRCYFFWDETKAQVIVGAIPNHLTTRAT